MTRRRGPRIYPDEWPTSSRAAKTQLALNVQLLRGDEHLTDEQRALIDALPDNPRARPVQHESAEMQLLAARVQRHWWAPGWWRWEHATMHRREAWRNASEGVRSGWPDCGLFIPWQERAGYIAGRPAIVGVVELKAPHRKPIRGGKGGVTDAQRACLDLLEACGFRTAVCYGADEAEAQLVEWAGPRPDVLPWPDTEAWRQVHGNSLGNDN